MGDLFIHGMIFRRLNLHCVNPLSKRGASHLVGTFAVTESCGQPVMLRLTARGKHNCECTRSSPSL